MIQPSVLANADCLELLISQLNEFVIVVASTEGKFTSWHPGVEQQFGYKADEFIGQGVELLFTPEDRMQGTPVKELKDAEETGRASDTRWLVKKDGLRILVEGVTIGLRDDAGKLAGSARFCAMLLSANMLKITLGH